MIYLLAIPLLWVLFLSYAGLKANWNFLRIEVKIAGGLVVLCGFALDVAINWTLGIVLGVTKDFTLSQKCGRISGGAGWQSVVARYLCQNWLDPFELGGHCR
ncbi:MAG: hypothetical protein KJ787_13860 [Gammaproteobacteria bacterium]|nr:hypothetical protein [Gammaproteobacteria bacterium]MBU1647412.1 hypothetical protein [Gammaproteobacteria bacterium]MBU1973204.1 hypothetical protein [Gammaproteobacteria bacterium]